MSQGRNQTSMSATHCGPDGVPWTRSGNIRRHGEIVRHEIASFQFCGAENQAVYVENRQQSAFLRLPAELRRIIFEIVYGSRCIEIAQWCSCHCNYDMSASRRDPCPAPKHGLFLACAKDYEVLPGPCLSNTKWLAVRRPRSRLVLPQVCRQMYHETALLPFRVNIFAIRNVHVLRPWLASLDSMQRSAIRSLFWTSSEPLFHSHWSRPCQVYEGYTFCDTIGQL